MKNLLPCKYPTTTIILDDNLSFLESIEMSISAKDRQIVYTTSPHDALKLINESAKHAHFNFVKTNNAGELKFDYSNIKEIAKNPLRNKEISVLIIDYHMPEMNGIEFCQKIKNLACQKILLTANSNQDIAVNAFNDGLIQQYIQKHDINLDKLLAHAIERAENQYAIHKFNSVITSIKNCNGLFSNANLQAILLDIIQKEEIVEYYLLDQNGSLLCMNKTGLTSKILVKHKEEIRIPLTLREAEYLPDCLSQEIWECKKTFCFALDDVSLPPASLWEKYLVPTIQIPNEEDWFLAVVKNPHESNINIDNK
jgi:CheY-like chemotaxis protein